MFIEACAYAANPLTPYIQQEPWVEESCPTRHIETQSIFKHEGWCQCCATQPMAEAPTLLP
jgi:hypothetical protein